DPGRLGTPGRYGYRHSPSGRSGGGRAARSLLSGLDGTAFPLPVYASSAGSPRRAQDSVLATGQAVPGGIRYPQGSVEGFPTSTVPPFPMFPGRKTAPAQRRGPPSDFVGDRAVRGHGLLQLLVRRRPAGGRNLIVAGDHAQRITGSRPAAFAISASSS